MGLQTWSTLLELKEDHEKIGLKGMVFFIKDIARNIKERDTQLIITEAVWTGMGLTGGVAVFAVNKKEIETYFTVLDKTYNEYAKELYEKSREEESARLDWITRLNDDEMDKEEIDAMLDALRRGLTHWANSFKECDPNIELYKENIRELKEGKRVFGDGNFRFLGLNTVEEKIAECEQGIKDYEEQRKETGKKLKYIEEALQFFEEMKESKKKVN